MHLIIAVLFLCMYREDITQWQEDMSFTFVIKWQEQFLFLSQEQNSYFQANV